MRPREKNKESNRLKPLLVRVGSLPGRLTSDPRVEHFVDLAQELSFVVTEVGKSFEDPCFFRHASFQKYLCVRRIGIVAIELIVHLLRQDDVLLIVDILRH